MLDMPDLFVSENEKKDNKTAVPPPPAPKVSEETTKRDVVNKVTNMKKGTIEYPKSEEEKVTLPGHSDNPLASFNYFPSKVDFINKDPEEKVVLVLRKHPITNLKWIIVSFAMIIFPTF